MSLSLLQSMIPLGLKTGAERLETTRFAAVHGGSDYGLLYGIRS